MIPALAGLVRVKMAMDIYYERSSFTDSDVSGCMYME